MRSIITFFQILGILGALLFYGRFYLQWYVSERRGQSVVPVGFWYMSGAGSVMLLLYGAFALNSPVGVLSHCFNSIIYARNLVHIWRERGSWTPTRSRWFRLAVGIVVGGGVALVFLTLLREYNATRESAPGEQARTWLWIGVGVVGQGLFALRFVIQWIVTEIQRKSVIPAIFWHISLVASALLLSSHLQRQEWLYAIGIATTLLVYARNIYWVGKGRNKGSES